MSKIIYIASPYNHPDSEIIEKNYLDVAELSAELCSQNVVALSPIVYGHTLLKIKDMPVDWMFWSNFCLSLLIKSDELWVFKIPGWDKSRGVTEEIQFAVDNNIPVKYIEYITKIK
jgi:hypothetical protein